jgi:hypothetical protein
LRNAREKSQIILQIALTTCERKQPACKNQSFEQAPFGIFIARTPHPVIYSSRAPEKKRPMSCNKTFEMNS